MVVSKKTLQGQVAVVTGASAGIGRAIALALGREGVRCVVAARRKKELQALVKEIESEGGEAHAVPTDVTREDDLKKLVEEAIRRFGDIHILVNNAGVYHRGAVEDMRQDELMRTLSVNLVAPVMLTKYALPHLKKNAGSAVINIASIAGTMGFAKGGAYAASKHGVIGFTESLFEEVREHGIKVCAVCPGFVDTPMVESYRLNKEKMIPPEDVAETVVDVLKLSVNACPSRIILRPQFSPYA